MLFKTLILVTCLCSFSYAEESTKILSLNENKAHPDVGLRVPALVAKYGYPLEVHTVITSDDYILTMHRIPHGKNNAGVGNKPVVFLMHGLLCSSADWVLMGPERGLAYLLADMGYDVWMGNARGNTYSRNHVSLSADRNPALVAKYGYPLEVHTVITSDDYILTMHRIPHGKNNAGVGNKPVVFLMHGLLCSSADWVLMGPERGLAYLLADMGYDVWMGNARGNTYSRNHVSLSADRNPALVAKYGYPLEVHTVITSDDYILTMHRIPHGKNNAGVDNKPVVFLMHGLLCSSADWVLMGPERGLAYLLADMGYDVWMGNARGNTYSRNHVSLSADQNPALVAKYGYPLEVHTVITSDDYILTMHRIPHGKNNAGVGNKPVVFLMHGLLCSSADWVLMGPERGLAYLLADMGYDVWMGNARGNTYSRNHVSLSADHDQKKFWDFSWHEIGIIDLPAMIDFILEKTGQEQIFYIGHSQGTTSFFVMTSSRPDYNDKIRLMVALAPVAYSGNIPNIALKLVAQFYEVLNWVTGMLGAHEFLPSTKFMQLIGQALCNDESILQDMCSNILFLIAGFDSQQLNKTMIPVILSNTPAGAATKQLLHYAQGVRSGKFRQYDYKLKNIFKYGQLRPPTYDLSQITAPVALLYGKNDFLADEKDIDKIKDEIKNTVVKYRVKHDKFNHLDFLWSTDIVPLLYERVFDLLERYQ